MPKYKLRRSFFDGRDFYRAGAVVEIEEGQVPSSATPLDEVPAKAKAKAESEPELALEPDVTDVKPGDTLASLGKSKK